MVILILGTMILIFFLCVFIGRVCLFSLSFFLKLNSKITEIHGLLLLTGKDDLLGFSEICDPFSSGPGYRYVPENCPKDAVAIGDIPNVSGY